MSGVYKKIASDARVTYGAISGERRDSIGRHHESATCTVFETTCNLVTILTGSGMLSLPFAAAESGWFAVVMLVILCAIFMYSFDLLARAIEEMYEQENLYKFSHIYTYHIDYLSLGQRAFGQYGDKIVLCIFGTEVTLALVSFLMNIGINLNVINTDISVDHGILLAAALTCALSFTNLKTVAYSSVIGLVLTLLVVFAILMTGLQLNDPVMLDTRRYELMNLSGVPISLGLIAFCFGGHGTFPKMYASMADRHRYRETLVYTAVVILGTYLVIMVSGYYFFAQYTLTPVTLNIGKDLWYHDTKHGFYLKMSAAFGIICNLQVTCPLVTFAIRDMALKIGSIDATEHTQRWTVLFILLAVTPIALTLSGNFAALCSLIGSFATIANSVVLPLVFFHTMFGDRTDTRTNVLHGVLLVVAVSAALVGIYANFRNMLL